VRLRWWPGAGSNRRPSDFQAERARPERSSRAESVLRRRDFVPKRSVIRELVLANPLANRSPGRVLRPSPTFPQPYVPQPPHSRSTQADRCRDEDDRQTRPDLADVRTSAHEGCAAMIRLAYGHTTAGLGDRSGPKIAR